MKACDPLFSAIADLESCNFALEDLRNLQTIFQDRLSQWGSEVDAAKPWTCEFFTRKLPLLLSLHCAICEKLEVTLDDMNQSVKAAYDAYFAREKPVTDPPGEPYSGNFPVSDNQTGRTVVTQ